MVLAFKKRMQLKTGVKHRRTMDDHFNGTSLIILYRKVEAKNFVRDVWSGSGEILEMTAFQKTDVFPVIYDLTT